MKRKASQIYTTLFFCTAVFVLISSCSKEPIRERPVDPPDDTTKTISFQQGVFVINEGNYNWGNASVTFLDTRNNSVFQDVFNLVNQRSLGDVAESMCISGKNGYIVINNSNRIEVVSMTDFKSVKTISGLHSPRFMTVVSPQKAYVTNLQNSISVIDLNTNNVTGTIKTSAWTENMIQYKQFVLVTSVGQFSEPSSGRQAQIFVVDSQSDEIIDSIQTGKEPIGLAIDKKDKVWVLCSGGYDNFEPPSLIRINPELRIVEKVFVFNDPAKLPSRLCMNSGGDTMYFLRNGIFRMAVTDAALPDKPFIASEGRLLYGLAIHPETGHIFTSDAIDYVQNGKVYEYTPGGSKISSFTAGRIPGSFCFTNN